MDEDDLQEGRRFDSPLALLDILGFKELVNSHTPAEVHSLLRRMQLKLDDIQVDAAGNSHLGTQLYSDSMLVYPHAEGAEGLMNLVEGVGEFISNAANASLLLRGTLVKGELVVTRDNQIFGKGIVRAYELEQGQKWGGVIIDQQTVGRTEEEQRALQILRVGQVIGDYMVPWSSNPSPRRHLCVNWPLYCSTRRDDLELGFKRLDPVPSEDGRAKREQTLDFFSTRKAEWATTAHEETARRDFIALVDDLNDAEKARLVRLLRKTCVDGPWEYANPLDFFGPGKS